MSQPSLPAPDGDVQEATLTLGQLLEIMVNKCNIRSVNAIASVDHGKFTRVDSLESEAGTIATNDAGEARFADSRQDNRTDASPSSPRS